MEISNCDNYRVFDITENIQKYSMDEYVVIKICSIVQNNASL